MKRLVIGLAIVLAMRSLAMYLIPLCAEDAYITFHAALDPAWMRATTSPLWALMMRPWGWPEVLARAWSLVADCVAVWAAWLVLGRWGFWAFIALWISPFFTGSAVSGLETHIVAAALILARVHPVGYAIAAALRPDAAILSLVVSGRRWRWALAGAAAFAVIGLCSTGHLIPQTVTSKALVYGVSGYKLFWWYWVAPFALLGLLGCWMIRRPWQLIVALLVMAWFFMPQVNTLRSRHIQEADLWNTGVDLAEKHPVGTILLEPAGMIPFLNHRLNVVDEAGLTDPWMATRRNAPGWRTAAIERYKPQWIVIRLREYLMPNKWTVGATAPYLTAADAKLPGYGIVLAPGIKFSSPNKFTTELTSSNLVILQRKTP